MGTRSLVHFHNDPFEDSKDEIIVTIYRQMDGYYDGRGAELAEWLAKFTVVNGFGMGEVAGTHANGMGCLAAQWISEEKHGIGGIYIQAPGVAEEDDVFIEYEYHVRLVNNELELEARGHDGCDLPFKGRPADFDSKQLRIEEEEDV